MLTEKPLPIGGKLGLSHLLWRQNHNLVGQTLIIPFLQELYEGTLEENHLRAYYQQDEYFQQIVRPYRRFVRSHVNSDAVVFDSNKAKEILNRQIQLADNLNIFPNRTTSDYIEFILINSDSLSAAATSLLPCSKLYNFLTRYLSRMNPSEKAISWINSHNYPGYKNNTDQLEYLVNLYSDNRSLDQLSNIFRNGLEHEILFFSQLNEKLY